MKEQTSADRISGLELELTRLNRELTTLRECQAEMRKLELAIKIRDSNQENVYRNYLALEKNCLKAMDERDALCECQAEIRKLRDALERIEKWTISPNEILIDENFAGPGCRQFILDCCSEALESAGVTPKCGKE